MNNNIYSFPQRAATASQPSYFKPRAADQDIPVEGGFQALGMSDGKLAVISKLDKRIHMLRPAELTELKLKTLFGVAWCRAHYEEVDEKKGVPVFDQRALATEIVVQCQAAGPYVDALQRKLGVWRMDDGGLVINGRELWRPDGTLLPHGLHGGRVYPASGDLAFNRDTPEATHAEVQHVLAAFNSPQWCRPLAGEIILGFLGVGIVSAALRRRPHVLMTGPAACGKSTILEYVRWLMGNLVYACTGPQTLASYYQSLGGTSKLVANDEFEADPSRKACKDTFEIARMSYSLQEGDEGIVRGTVSGKARNFSFFSPFIAAGISPGKMEPADLTRWVVLEAKGKPSGVRMTEPEARSLGPKLARLFVNRWSAFQVTEDAVRQCILSSGGDSRMADTVGTLLASYWTFTSATPASAEDAAQLVSMLGVEERIDLHQVSDEIQCLEALLTKVAPFKVLQDGSANNRHLSIAEAIEAVCHDPTGQPDVVARLAQLGLRVTHFRGRWTLYVTNSHSHQELRRLFAGTKWSSGGWALVLRRLPGGTESTQRIGAGSGAVKVTAFDVPEHLLPPSDSPLAA
jgi:hypothetical protein